jgi:hypothetical protein
MQRRIVVRAFDAQRESWERTAEAHGIGVSEFIRYAADRAVRELELSAMERALHNGKP